MQGFFVSSSNISHLRTYVKNLQNRDSECLQGSICTSQNIGERPNN